LLIVLSGLSGAGKDTLIQALLKRKLHLQFVVTTTSREPRSNEINGVDYHFISREKFEQMIKADKFIEYAKVYKDYKGPQKKHVHQALKSGNDVILRLDYQGAIRIRELNPEAVLIFLAPENKVEWLTRLKKRGTETPASLRIRLDTASKEMASLDIFDYIVINADNKLEEAVDAVEAIIRAEHLRIHPKKITL
jgi:guanylate kinase